MTANAGEVKLVRWPAESERLRQYRKMAVPRLLVVEADAQPPVTADVREDWVRPPVSQQDLRARMAALWARARAGGNPEIDPDGVLRYGSRMVTVSPTEADLLAPLVRGFGQLVARETLRDQLPGDGHSGRRNALNLHIMRIRRRIEPLGLQIRTAWGRGYLLEPAGQASA